MITSTYLIELVGIKSYQFYYICIDKKIKNELNKQDETKLYYNKGESN